MLPGQAAHRLPHLHRVQVIIAELGIKPQKRIRDLVVVDPVDIGLPAVLFPGMPVRRNLLRCPDPDVLRQPLIQGEGELLRRHTHLRIEHGNVSQGVDAGICPACKDDGRFFPRQLFDCLIQFFFDGDTVRLDLGPAVGGPVIADGQSDSSHGSPRNSIGAFIPAGAISCRGRYQYRIRTAMVTARKAKRSR